MDQGDDGAFSRGNGPTAAQEIYLVVGVDPAAQMERQMQVQQRGRRTGTYRGTLLL